METDNAAILQVILNKLNRLEQAVLADAAAIDKLSSDVDEFTARLEEAVDVALRNLPASNEEIPF